MTKLSHGVVKNIFFESLGIFQTSWVKLLPKKSYVAI